MAKFQWLILCSIISFLTFNAGIFLYVINQCTKIALAQNTPPAQTCPELGKNYGELGIQTLSILLALGAFSGTPGAPPGSPPKPPPVVPPGPPSRD